MTPQLWRYSIPSEKGEGWAVFVIGSDGYFSACSDYGNYAFWWSHHGSNDFRSFLLRAKESPDYFESKLSNGASEFSPEKTEARIKELILERRRSGWLDKDEAREEWDRFSGLYSDFEFQDNCARSTIDDLHELAVYETPCQVAQFVRNCMARLIPLLKADLEKQESILEAMGI